MGKDTNCSLDARLGWTHLQGCSPLLSERHDGGESESVFWGDFGVPEIGQSRRLTRNPHDHVMDNESQDGTDSDHLLLTRVTTPTDLSSRLTRSLPLGRKSVVLLDISVARRLFAALASRDDDRGV